MEKEYIIALIGAGGVIGGILLNEIIGFIKKNSERKTQFVLNNFSLRQKAYIDLYFSLTKYQDYYSYFINYGNEFIEHKEPEEFGPLAELGKLIEECRKIEIWLHKDTIEALDDLFGHSSVACNIAISLHSEDRDINRVEEISAEIYTHIAKIKDHVRKLNGIEELDKLNSKLIK